MNSLKAMETRDKKDHLKWLLEKQLSWIASADGKVSSYFAIETAMVAVLAAITPAWNTLFIFSGMVLFSAYLLLLGGLGCLAFVVFPRVKGPERSLVYFGGIASRKVDHFSEELEKIDDETLVKDLAFQCHRNAEIAKSKYTWVRRSAAFLYSAVIPWLISVLLIFRSK